MGVHLVFSAPEIITGFALYPELQIIGVRPPFLVHSFTVKRMPQAAGLRLPGSLQEKKKARGRGLRWSAQAYLEFVFGS